LSPLSFLLLLHKFQRGELSIASDQNKLNIYCEDESKKNRSYVSKNIKNKVLVRQKYKCYYCGIIMPATRHFHNRKPNSIEGKNRLDNIIAVCPNCHFDIHHRQKLREGYKKTKYINRKFRGIYTPPKF
jgi:5-methylcytosine-specific restriction endonuclease McrA